MVLLAKKRNKKKDEKEVPPAKYLDREADNGKNESGSRSKSTGLPALTKTVWAFLDSVNGGSQHQVAVKGHHQQEHPKSILATSGRDEAIKICQEKVAKISKECRMNNRKYRDPHFDLSMAPSYCLYGLTSAESGVPHDCKRVGDIFDKPRFIVDGVESQDIKQGSTGDCWFLAAVATIVNVPSLLESICVARDEKVGVYGFIFFRDGEWISEVIDDQLALVHPKFSEANPVLKAAFKSESQYDKALRKGSQALLYGKCDDSNETWLPLLEKAYAKAHGDYSAIEGGLTGEGVEDLTGGVTSFLLVEDILDRDHFWKEELLKANQELLFACSKRGGQEEEFENGLISGHAYSVLRAVEVNGKRMVQIRNPWGASEWNGPWSDGSAEWTAEWMTLLNHRFGDDGAFWMTFEDMLASFDYIERTRIFSPQWSVSQMWTHEPVFWPARFAEQEFSFQLAQKGPVVIVLQQADSRYFRGLEGQYEFVLNFRLRKEGSNSYFARTQSLRPERSVNLELTLGSGTWIVSYKIARVQTDRPTQSEFIAQAGSQSWLKSDKFMQVARSYDYIYSRALCSEEEDPEVMMTKIEHYGEEDDPSSEEPEEEDGQEICQAEEEEEAGNAEGAEGEEEHDEACRDNEDSVAIVGLRIYTHKEQGEIGLQLIPADLSVLEEGDPDDSFVKVVLDRTQGALLSRMVASM